MSLEPTLADVVRCGDDVREAIRAHVDSDLEREVGGFLAGRLQDGRATIELAVPALRAEGHRTNVIFTHEVWDDVLATLDRDHPELRIVGWYHSHPGFGIFLSEYDTFIHRNFFPADGMVALVVDPHTGADGWFGSRAGEVVRLDGDEPVAVPRDRPETPPVAPSPQAGPSGPRGAVVLVGAATLLAGLIAGWGLADSGPVPDRGQVDALTDQVATLESREADLLAQLADARDVAEQAAAETAETDDPSEAAGTTDEGADPEGFRYRVRPGDTLRGIAALLAPDEDGYLRRLIDANPQLDDPDVLSIDDELWIPLPRESS